MADHDVLRPPLFVKPDEPLFVFENTNDVLKIEWQDVLDEPYQGYDADGRPFLVEARTWRRTFLRLLTVEDGETTLNVLASPKRPEDLRRLLIQALAGSDAATRSDLEARSLAELQVAALDRYRYEYA